MPWKGRWWSWIGLVNLWCLMLVVKLRRFQFRPGESQMEKFQALTFIIWFWKARAARGQDGRFLDCHCGRLMFTNFHLLTSWMKKLSLRKKSVRSFVHLLFVSYPFTRIPAVSFQTTESPQSHFPAPRWSQHCLQEPLPWGAQCGGGHHQNIAGTIMLGMANVPLVQKPYPSIETLQCLEKIVAAIHNK